MNQSKNKLTLPDKPRKVQMQTYLDEDVSEGIRELADELECSLGSVVAALYKFYKDNK